MKKFLIVFGSFILFVITIGTMFKLMHWPGAGPLLVIGMFFFAGFFLPIFFIHRAVTHRTGLNIVTNIFALFSTSLLFMGVLFKVMHWPGSAPMIVLGATVFVIPTLILYMVQQFKEYDRKFSEFWRVVTMGILVSVFFIFWGTNVSRNILYADLKMEDAVLEVNRDLSEYNALLLGDIQADSNAAVIQKAKNIQIHTVEVINFIDEVKNELVSYVDSNPDAIDNHWVMHSLDNYDISTHYLCGPNGRGAQLSEKLHLYKKNIEEELKGLPFENKKEIIEQLGDFAVKTELNEELMYNFDTWEDGMFYGQTISSCLGLLTGVQNEVLNAEFKCLKAIRANLN